MSRLELDLANKIRDDILDLSIPLSSTLRRAKVLAYQLENDEFKNWVEWELNGYLGVNIDLLPDYRKGKTQSYGDFLGYNTLHKNMPIPTLNFPEELQKFAENYVTLEGVRSLESMVDSGNTLFQEPWPANLTAMISHHIYARMTCMTAWKAISVDWIAQLLDTIRNRLLTFILELAQIQSEVDGVSPDQQRSIPNEEIKQLVQNIIILGSYNIVRSETTSFQGELNMSDTFDLSGDFRGSILNIKSTLDNVSQTINEISSADQSEKDELKQLVNQLNEALQEAPDEHAEDAEAIAESAKQLVETAARERPNKTMLHVSAEGLKLAAQNIASVMPDVLSIATKIIAAIHKINE